MLCRTLLIAAAVSVAACSKPADEPARPEGRWIELGMLAGRTWRHRAGYAAIAFGTWDIFYYVFLRLMSGWPRTLLDWDILFLLPLPWWGPVLAPVTIAMLMIVWGTLVTQSASRATEARWAAMLAGIGIGYGLPEAR